jgi:23S rRNA (uracil1939-C5)-methyltransferase
MSTETITINAIGAEGDGIARTQAGPIYVPFVLPGEEVAIARVKSQGTVMSWASRSPDRVDARCQHFGPEGKNGACGGCSLQHWADKPYQNFKRQLVIHALKSQGIETDVGEIVTCQPGKRRRVAMTGRNTEKSVVLGFSQGSTHHIVDVEDCPVASPAIMAKLDVIRKFASMLTSNAEPFRVTITETRAGLDVNFADMKKPDDAKRRALVDGALKEKGIARISYEAEILIEQQKPEIDFSGILVNPPPGTFTQATVEAEEAMAELVIGHVGKSKLVADLFSGCGTFALRLARTCAVHAVEFDGPALSALDQAARRTQGLKPVTIERRDLFRRPLQPMDLKKTDAVIFDPPRAGAETQAKELARSKVAKIAAVSCNPVTLARDLRILIDGGYKLLSVTPIDQFLWSSHVEAVALLER